MDSRLREAACNGDVAALHRLLAEDPLLLQKLLQATAETPLHIACLLGHVDFAAQILDKCPEFAQRPDEHGFYPLHLAAARGHVDIVKQMMKMKPLRQQRDSNGRTPLLLAAANGQILVLEEILKFDKALARDTTERQETALHLSVKHNQIEAAKSLVAHDKNLLNMKDDIGNTVLHLATARKQIQMLKLFLTDTTAINVLNDKNKYNMTVLDVLIQSPSEADDLEIGEMLRIAGCTERQYFPTPQPETSPPPTCSKLKSWLENCWKEWHTKNVSETHNTLMIVATLIATVTFTSGLNPPGGFWQDPPENQAPSPLASPPRPPGKAINNENSGFELFIYFDMIGLVSSLTIILFLISGLPLKNQFMTWILVITMWVSVSSVTMAFVFGTKLIIISRTISNQLFLVLVMWVGLMFLLLMCHCVFLIGTFILLVLQSMRKLFRGGP